MFALKNYPEHIEPQELDAYLANGWYRMGQTIFTTHFLCFGTTFYSAIWVRLDLDDFSFKKSLRRLKRQNDTRFRTVFQPAVLDAEKEALYQLYRADFPGLIAPTLLDSLQDGDEANIYNTYEFSAYDGDHLVATSFFDLGKDSLSSILGVYHPGYKKYSLGLYTMVKEIEFGLDNGFRYFYPGYVVPGNQRFDYKLRIGDVDYFNLAIGDWTPYEELKPEDIPVVKMEAKLTQLAEVLRQNGLSANLYYYPLFEANLFGFWRIPFFDYPLFLHCGSFARNAIHHFVVFDPRTNQYQLLCCTNFEDIQFYFAENYQNAFNQDRFFLELEVVDHIIESSADTLAITEALKQTRSGIPTSREAGN